MKDYNATHFLIENEVITSDSKNLYESFFENNYAVMLLIDPVTGSIKDANKSAVKFYGYSKDKLLQMNISDINILTPEEVKLEMQKAENLKNNYFNFRHKLSNGEICDVEVFSGPLTINSKNYLFSHIYDATSKIKAERELRESEEKYRKLIELSPDMVFVQTESKFVLINPVGVRLFGAQSEDELIGKCVLDFVHPDEYNSIKERIRKNNELRLDAPLQEHRYKRLDGSYFWVEVSAKPLEYKGKAGALVFARDISERKKADEELRRSYDALEQFAYVASHDLQEPLRMIACYTQLLADRYKDKLDETAGEYINFSVEGAKRMQRLIKDLLEFSRLTTNKSMKQKCDLNKIIQEVILNLEVTLKEKNAMLTVGSLPALDVDPAQISRLFQNLIINAVKFNDKKTPLIKISAELKDYQWLFSINDNGIGIDFSQLEKIFIVFSRLHNQQEYQGTGIGLSICKKIIESHGGSIWAESEPGKGSTFYFTIPI